MQTNKNEKSIQYKRFKKIHEKRTIQRFKFNRHRRTSHDMSNESDTFKKSLKESSDRLAKLGSELGQIRFSYKVKDKPDDTYWDKRIADFKKYREKSLEYYNQVIALMKLIDKDESNVFLLSTGKLHQTGISLIESMMTVKENPNIMNSRDKQQSQWSKGIRDQVINKSSECLHLETAMNSSFREFYAKRLKVILVQCQ